MIKNFKPREYQDSIARNSVGKNSLVVLPTGLGKTNIFLIIAALRLKQYPDSKILLLGPTRPLIDQYREVFIKHFEVEDDEVIVLTGHIKPEKRQEMFNKAKIILSTPQGMENDLISGRISLNDISLLGFDEAHKSVGDYAYVWIAKQYNQKAKHPRIVGMTASPGSDKEKIDEICQNLFIENIEVRTESDLDVKSYVKQVKIRWISVELPEKFISIKKDLTTCINTKVEEIKTLGDFKLYAQISRKDILSLQAQVHSEISQGNKDFNLLRVVSLLAEIMKVQHAMELIETQGIEPLYNYLNGILTKASTSKTKAVQNLARDVNFKSALLKTTTLYQDKVLHPKLIELKKIIKEKIFKQPDIKIIIFNHYRDNAKMVVEQINKLKEANAKLFVGQAKKNNTGLSQKEQKAMLDEFRKGNFNVICMTSVGEEGLDIPKVDLVMFYEPIPSSIRHIQRRGRTGRLDKGEVLILMTKGTRDEAYRWSAHHKEKRMFRTLNSIKNGFELEKPKQPTLDEYNSTESNTNGLKIFVDHREKGSRVIKNLIDNNVDLKLEQLESADYILSSRVAVEYKTREDFINSIVDGRLLFQLKDLKNSYDRPMIIVEGTQDLYSVRKVHPKAIQGMLATIAISYGIPIIYTKSAAETASILMVIAAREQEESGSDYSLHGSKKPLALKEQQEYIVSALPGIGPGLAKDLLKKFRTIDRVFNANEEDLTQIDKIGTKKAKTIRNLIEKTYS